MTLPAEIHPEDRKAMEGRAATLDRHLAHRDDRETARVVAGLFANYPSGKVGGDEARMTTLAYVSTLSDLPPWAVDEAAKGWLRGGYGAVASAFAPSSAQLHQAAEEIVRPFVSERRQLTELLEAEVREITEDERSRVAAGFDALREELGAPPLVPSSDFVAMCERAGVDPDSVPDAKRAGKKLEFRL